MCWQHQRKMVSQDAGTFLESQVFSSRVCTNSGEKTSIKCLSCRANKKFSQNNPKPCSFEEKCCVFRKVSRNVPATPFCVGVASTWKSPCTLTKLILQAKQLSKNVFTLFFSTCDQQQNKPPPIRKRLNFEECRIFTQIGNT